MPCIHRPIQGSITTGQIYLQDRSAKRQAKKAGQAANEAAMIIYPTAFFRLSEQIARIYFRLYASCI